MIFNFLCLLTLIIHSQWISMVKRQRNLIFNYNIYKTPFFFIFSKSSRNIIRTARCWYLFYWYILIQLFFVSISILFSLSSWQGPVFPVACPVLPFPKACPMCSTHVTKGMYVFNWGRGGPGLRMWGSIANFLQIWEGQTCFIRNFKTALCTDAVMWVTLPVSYFHLRLLLSWRRWGDGQMFFCVRIGEGPCINPFWEVGDPRLSHTYFFWRDSIFNIKQNPL